MKSASAQLDLSLYPTPPTQVLSATTGWSALNLRELLRSHELLFSLAWRDVRARYKQTALGILWVVVQPLLGAGIFSFIFSLVAGIEAPGDMPYFLFTLAGLVAWNSFSAILSRSSGALVANAPLVSKIYFPRLVLPVASVLTTLVDFLVAFTMLVVLAAIFWHLPGGWRVLLVPVCVALLWALSLGIGLCAAAVSVTYRDVLYALPVLSQFLMWGSAVLFPTSQVPERYLWIFYLNPIVSLIEVFRFAMLGAGEVRWDYFGYSSLVVLIVLFCGTFAFRRMERSFADVI